MKFFLRLIAWTALYSLIPFTYLLLYRWDPVENTIVYEFPKPTKFSRVPEVYDAKNFGAAVKAGFGKRDITPPRFCWLGGYHPPHFSIAINDQLWAKSLALEDQQGKVAVFVSCDLIGLLPDEIQKMKALVKDLVNPGRVFIGCTHTHSSPDTMGIWGLVPLVTDGKSKRYLRFLEQQVAAAIRDSLSNLSNASIRFGNGEFKGYVHGRFENPNDESVSVLQVLLASGKPVTLVNFACHADVIKSLYVSADFPYFLEYRLEHLTGGEAIFLQGAIGGVQPSKGGEYNDSPYYARVLGENLADAVVFRFLKKPLVPKSAEISVRKLELKAPLENKNFAFGARTGALPELRDENGLITAEVNRITVGPAEIVTVPGELFPKIWWHVKPLMRGRPNFIFGLTNGEFGYILLPEDFASKRHRYHTTVSVGPTFGTNIENALKKILTKR